MKKILSLITIFLCSSMVSQELMSKDGEPVLPQAKDWGIGIDATKLIKNAAFSHIASSQALMGKYFKDAKTAYRVGIRIGVNDWTTKERVTDRLAATNTLIAYPAAEATKQNTWKRTATAFGVSFGLEKRKGNTRLQGFYGAEGAIFISTIRDKFSYGNALSPNPSAPVTVTSDDAMYSDVFGNANNIDTVPPIQGVQGSARVIERKTTPSLSLGARAFIGVEYFIVPKIAIGGEFGWGFMISTVGRTETTLESIGQSNSGNVVPSAKKTTLDSGTSNAIRVDSDAGSLIGGSTASLRLSFYF
jgi:hypothetical protein